MKRKHFLQSVLGASAFLGLPFTALGNDSTTIQELINTTKRDVKGTMFGFSTDPISKVRVGIIGLGNRGNTLLEMFQYLVENEMAEIIALSDISEEKVNKAAEKLAVWQSKKPVLYHKSKSE